jgi:hypothetical protein
MKKLNVGKFEWIFRAGFPGFSRATKDFGHSDLKRSFQKTNCKKTNRSQKKQQKIERPTANYPNSIQSTAHKTVS